MILCLPRAFSRKAPAISFPLFFLFFSSCWKLSLMFLLRILSIFNKIEHTFSRETSWILAGSWFTIIFFTLEYWSTNCTYVHTFSEKIPTNYRLDTIHIVKPKRKYFRFSKCDASSIVAILGLLESWFSHLFMTWFSSKVWVIDCSS